MKIMKNEVCGASGGLLGDSRLQERTRGGAKDIFGGHFSGKVRFWAPFWDPVDFEGGPKNAFLGILLEKNKKKEVQERCQKKHEI